MVDFFVDFALVIYFYLLDLVEYYFQPIKLAFQIDSSEILEVNSLNSEEAERFVFLEALLLSFGWFKLAQLVDLSQQAKFSKVNYSMQGAY